MQLGHPELATYWCEIITHDYRLHGSIQPIGSVFSHLNDEQWRYLQVRDVTLAAFDEENPIAKREFPLLMIRKDDIVALSLLDEGAVQAATLLTTTHCMILYTLRFIIKGDVHMYADDVPLATLSTGKHGFVAATSVSLYPLRRLRHAPSATSSLMFLNRHSVDMYHLAGPD